MEIVQPIRDRKKIEAMKKYLRGQSIRDHLMFVYGINAALRISDELKLHVYDVVDNSGDPRWGFEFREKKTGKSKMFPYASNVKKAIREYMQVYQPLPEQHLFVSRKGNNEPINRKSAWRILSEAAEAVGIDQRIGSHSLRKTFGYHAYKKGVSINTLQDIFNHSSQKATLRYIGITQDEIDDVYISLNL